VLLRRTLAIAYRDIFMPFQSNAEGQQWGGEEYAAQKVEKDLTLIALVGIQDPLRPKVPASIAQCHRAGITVRMLTGEFPFGLHHALHCVW
jgi:P-type E1-E2 ATPase